MFYELLILPHAGLYGTRVRPVPAFGSLSNKPVSDPALIHRILPDELLFEVFTLIISNILSLVFFEEK
jgi:hypothetical protein